MSDDRVERFVNEVVLCFGAPPVSTIILRHGEKQMTYENTNKGALFRNDEKADTDRDYSGTLDVAGTEYWLSGWVRTSKKGAKYLSLSVKPKDAPKERAQEEKPRADELDGEIPF